MAAASNLADSCHLCDLCIKHVSANMAGQGNSALSLNYRDGSLHLGNVLFMDDIVDGVVLLHYIDW